MRWLEDDLPPTRDEIHFGSQMMKCFVDRPRSLSELLADAVASNAAGEALVANGHRLTYAQFDDEVARVAGGLAALGITSGDRIALLIGNRIEFAVLIFAAARLGAIWSPLNVREQTRGIQQMLEDSAATAIVYDDALTDRLPDPAAVPSLIHRIALDAEGGYPRLSRHVALRITSPASEDDVAAIFFTSGTTGRAKGAMLTHLGFIHSAMTYQICMNLTPSDRSILCVPFGHVTGVVAIFLTMVRAAGATILMPEFKADKFLKLAAQEKMTHTVMVPAMYNLCLLRDDFANNNLSSWRVGGFGGAPMPPVTIERLARALPNLKLMNLYGATETTSPSTIMPPQLIAHRGDSVGLVVPCAEVVIVDEDGRPVAPNEAGEVWIRGPMVVPGYWNNAAATASEFLGGFWRSGDIGSMDQDGFLYVFDRKKDVINRGGHKIYAAEVENILLGVPEVAEAAVVAKHCPVLGERVHAFIVPREGMKLDANVLAQVCSASLSDYKTPESFTFLETPLPRNANGKILKHVLRDISATSAAPR